MKPTDTIANIMSRRSVRAYKSDPIPQDVLNVILEAGQAAPYVMRDSRHFTVIQSRNMLDRINKTALIEGQKISEQHRQMFSIPGFDGTYGAPVAIILSGNENTIQHEVVCAASAQNMLIAAQSLGISSCWVYFPIFIFHGEDSENWRKQLQIPENYQPCVAILLGYGLEEPTDERYKNEITYIEK